MDDNFASLVRAVVWGRCVYDAIRKFLQFQLTVNVSAVVIAITTSIHSSLIGKGSVSVLTTIQLLWVNLIMDTLAALALATDKPSLALLQRKPSKKDEPIVNSEMLIQIVGQAIYQIIVCLVLYFNGTTWWPITSPVSSDSKKSHMPTVGYVASTVIFNTFIFCQIFNEINSRSLSRKGIFSSCNDCLIYLTCRYKCLQRNPSQSYISHRAACHSHWPNYHCPVWLGSVWTGSKWSLWP